MCHARRTCRCRRWRRSCYSDGSVLARIGDQSTARSCQLDQVPEAVRYDVIAAEDRGFYSEPGVSIKGTLRAAFTDLTGGDTQGGSAITQQYVKNAYLSDSRTLSRKLQELLIAVKLAPPVHQGPDPGVLPEHRLLRPRRLRHRGSGAGILRHRRQQAERRAGRRCSRRCLRAPSYYDPAGNPAAAKERWQYVIDGMVTIKQLTQPQAAALGYPTVLPPKKTNGLGATGNTALIVHRVLVELEAQRHHPGRHLQTRAADQDDDQLACTGSSTHRDLADFLRADRGSRRT